MRLEAPGAAAAVCCICYDDCLPTERLACAGPERHVFCGTCLGKDISRQAEKEREGRGPKRAAGELLAVRCVHCKFGAPAFTDAQLAAVLPPDVLPSCLGAVIATREALQKGRDRQEAHAELTELRRRLGEAEARNGDLAKMRAHVADAILTTRCPHCSLAFGGFTGCFALDCQVDMDSGAAKAAAAAAAALGAQLQARCGNAFCAWCFEKCGADAHGHVARCAWKLADQVYHGKEADYKASVRRRQLHQLGLLRESMEADLWGALVDGMKIELDGLTAQCTGCAKWRLVTDGLACTDPAAHFNCAGCLAASARAAGGGSVPRCCGKAAAGCGCGVQRFGVHAGAQRNVRLPPDNQAGDVSQMLAAARLLPAFLAACGLPPALPAAAQAAAPPEELAPASADGAQASR